MLADALGRPLRFRIAPGQIHDITAALPLLEDQNADAILADKAYDSNELRDRIVQMKVQAVIPSKRNRKPFIPHDTELYKERNRIERCLQSTQAFSPFRHPSWQANYPFQRVCLSRRGHDLASLNVDPA